MDPGHKKYRTLKGNFGGGGEGSLVYEGSCKVIEGGERHSARWLSLWRGQFRLPQICTLGLEEENTRSRSISGTASQLSLTGGLDFLVMYVCCGCDAHGWSCIHGGSCFPLSFLLVFVTPFVCPSWHLG